MTGARIRVALADDQALILAGLRLILDQEAGIEVVGQAADGAQAVALAARTRPDVILMDIRMPGMDGIEATRRITAGGSTQVIMLTTFGEDEQLYAAMRAGAAGFLLKDVDPPDLVHAITLVARGEAVLAPALVRRLVERFTVTAGAPEALGRLTEREREIFRMLARGLTNEEIAAALFISPATVKTHVSRVLTKLDLRDRTQAVVAGYEWGIVVPGRRD